MSTRTKLVESGLIAACILSTVGGLAALGQSKCTGPTTLEANVHAHPGATAYVQLGRWFGQRHQNTCATAAFQAAIKLEPRSAEISYLLGTTLYFSGRLQEAVDALARSVQIDPSILEPHLLLASALDKGFGGPWLC